jgi:hypothetical protein
MDNPEQNQRTSVKDSVLGKIECGELCPRPRLFFQTRECVVWFFWFLSILIGSLAVAISVFAISYQQFALYEATHENLLTFLIAVLPSLWLLLFVAMVLIGVYNLKHTKRGYRYPLWVIVGSSVVLSFAGGSALQFFGFGAFMDHELGEQMGMYTSQEKMEKRMWQNPEDGRLLGRQTYATVAPTSTIVFADVTGKAWRVDVSELSLEELQLLETEATVKLIGTLSSKDAAIFHSCGAFKWTFDASVSRRELQALRLNFLQRMGDHLTRRALEDEESNEGLGEAAHRPCDDLPILERMKR